MSDAEVKIQRVRDLLQRAEQIICDLRKILKGETGD